MATKARPKTRKLTSAERSTMVAAREAITARKSLKPVAFRAARSKADKAAYLQAHLQLDAAKMADSAAYRVLQEAAAPAALPAHHRSRADGSRAARQGRQAAAQRCS